MKKTTKTLPKPLLVLGIAAVILCICMIGALAHTLLTLEDRATPPRIPSQAPTHASTMPKDNAMTTAKSTNDIPPATAELETAATAQPDSAPLEADAPDQTLPPSEPTPTAEEHSQAVEKRLAELESKRLDVQKAIEDEKALRKRLEYKLAKLEALEAQAGLRPDPEAIEESKKPLPALSDTQKEQMDSLIRAAREEATDAE